MTGRILVAYASGSGSTAEVAQTIGDVLSQSSVPVDVHDVREVEDLWRYSAVVLGSSSRAGRWLPEAIRFLQDNHSEFVTRPVAYFTTCLTLAEENTGNRRIVLAYMEPILRLAPEVDPVGLGLFAGSLDPQRTLIMQTDAGPQGDYRNWTAIRTWAEKIRPALVQETGWDRGPLALAGAILSFTDLSRMDLCAYDLRRANLQAATLQGSQLVRADLKQANLFEADLRQADLRQAFMAWADLQQSTLHGADLTDANLMGAELCYADLRDIKLVRAVLNGANLNHADLQQADLTSADLAWANLTGTNLAGANLSNANLAWANLSEANLKDATLESARYNAQTAWPADFSPQTVDALYAVQIC